MNQTWTVFSPAKVNLHLSIGAKRDDGYHDAYSVMHALTLHDTVTVACERLAEDAPLAVDVRCTAHGGVDELSIASEDNIAHKAIVALAEECGLSEAGYRFSVHIDKHIPHAAGLGGGSSNAAAALLAACRAFGIESEDERVLRRGDAPRRRRSVFPARRMRASRRSRRRVRTCSRAHERPCGSGAS